MKKKLFILFLLLIISCTQITTEEITKDSPQEIITEKIEIEATLPIKTIIQTYDNSKTTYGFDEKNNLIRAEFPDKVFELFYSDGKLTEIKDILKIEYSREKVESIDKENKVLKFEYDSKNNLVKIFNDETLSLIYGSTGLLRQASRGAVKTNLDYYSNGLMQYISRGSTTSDVLYDDKDRIKKIGTGNFEMLFEYWRDNKLIKLTGRTFGKGLQVSYGPENQPYNAKIISAEDDSEFTSTDTETLYSLVDMYLYCNYVRRLPVIFDGSSYAFFINYFKGSVEDYFIMNEMCEIYE